MMFQTLPDSNPLCAPFDGFQRSPSLRVPLSHRERQTLPIGRLSRSLSNEQHSQRSRLFAAVLTVFVHHRGSWRLLQPAGGSSRCREAALRRCSPHGEHARCGKIVVLCPQGISTNFHLALPGLLRRIRDVGSGRGFRAHAGIALAIRKAPSAQRFR